MTVQGQDLGRTANSEEAPFRFRPSRPFRYPDDFPWKGALHARAVPVIMFKPLADQKPSLSGTKGEERLFAAAQRLLALYRNLNLEPLFVLHAGLPAKELSKGHKKKGKPGGLPALASKMALLGCRVLLLAGEGEMWKAVQGLVSDPVLFHPAAFPYTRRSTLCCLLERAAKTPDTSICPCSLAGPGWPLYLATGDLTSLALGTASLDDIARQAQDKDLLDELSTLAQDPLLSHTKIMSEGFQLEEIYEERHIPNFRNLAEYNDGFMLDVRRFLKGDEGQLAPFAWRARRNPSEYAVINYMANHNGFTLLDAVSYDEKHNEANGEENHDGTDYNYSWNCGEEGPSRKKKTLALRARQLRNAFVLLLLSQGTPLIYGGDERGNSQSGNNNVYCQDNELSWVNWKTGKAFGFLTDYVKGLIAFRRAHPVFHQKQELRMTDYLSCGHPDLSYHGKRAWLGDFENYSRSVGAFYGGDYIEANSGGKETDSFFYVAYNMHWIPHEFALPDLPGKGNWKIAIDTGLEGTAGIYEEGKEPLLSDQRTVTVPERTILVLTGRRGFKKDKPRTPEKKAPERKAQKKKAAEKKAPEKKTSERKDGTGMKEE